MPQGKRSLHPQVPEQRSHHAVPGNALGTRTPENPPPRAAPFISWLNHGFCEAANTFLLIPFSTLRTFELMVFLFLMNHAISTNCRIAVWTAPVETEDVQWFLANEAVVDHSHTTAWVVDIG